MPPLLTVTGRDVLFAHWPVEPSRLRPHVPDPLSLDTFDGSAWVSVLALENTGAAPGTLTPPGTLGGSPQINLRTYVSLDGEPGVYFLSLDTGSRAVAEAGRRVFGLPFRHARIRLRRRGGPCWSRGAARPRARRSTPATGPTASRGPPVRARSSRSAPSLRYSPGFEMAVQPPERRAVDPPAPGQR